jgi:hypothetical protein
MNSEGIMPASPAAEQHESNSVHLHPTQLLEASSSHNHSDNPESHRRVCKRCSSNQRDSASESAFPRGESKPIAEMPSALPVHGPRGARRPSPEMGSNMVPWLAKVVITAGDGQEDQEELDKYSIFGSTTNRSVRLRKCSSKESSLVGGELHGCIGQKTEQSANGSIRPSEFPVWHNPRG